MKKYKWEQEQIANMKEYIARFGHGSAKLARQAQVRHDEGGGMRRMGVALLLVAVGARHVPQTVHVPPRRLIPNTHPTLHPRPTTPRSPRRRCWPRWCGRG